MHHLATARLVLTAVTDTDLDDMFALSSLPEVNLHNPDGPDTDISQSRERLSAWIADWQDNGIGYHTARDHEGRYVGYVGVTFREFRGERLLNLAYRIRPEFQGQGLVTEACQAVLTAAGPAFPGTRVRALTKQTNAPSIAVARRLGFTHAPEFDNVPDEGDINFFLTLR